MLIYFWPPPTHYPHKPGLVPDLEGLALLNDHVSQPKDSFVSGTRQITSEAAFTLCIDRVEPVDCNRQWIKVVVGSGLRHVSRCVLRQRAAWGAVARSHSITSKC